MAKVRLGVFTDRGGWELYRGKANQYSTKTRVLGRKRLRGASGGSCMQLRIPLSELREKGWYTVKVDIKEKGNLDDHVYTFSFYHSNAL